ncbi:hypothetical protein HZS_2921 [Henneguya salminicola]|nr:hypothetical protein HZS_2921 [Henneguya salminicola]
MQFIIHTNNVYFDAVDRSNPMPIEYDFNFDLNGALGNMARVIIYALVAVFQQDINSYRRDFYIKLHSILWKNYRLSNSQCCSNHNMHLCIDPCAYIINFLLSDELLETFEYPMKTKLKQNPFHIYIATHYSAPQSKYNISVEVKHFEFDIAFINSDIYSKTEATNGIKLQNIHENRFLCHRYTSPFCRKKCRAIPHIEYCDYEKGNRYCINGARDIDCERNVNQSCSDDICTRNGLCKIINNKINCKCNMGYKGKFCKNLICRNDCNGNGYCISQGACACNSIYKGKLCNEYPCSENIVNPCKNGGICFHTNNSIKCYCPFEYINGKHCQTLSCGKKCQNGQCIFLKNEWTYKFLCSGGWYGPKCSIWYFIILGIFDVDRKGRNEYFQFLYFNVSQALIAIFLLFNIQYVYRRQQKIIL